MTKVATKTAPAPTPQFFVDNRKSEVNELLMYPPKIEIFRNCILIKALPKRETQSERPYPS